MYIEPFPNEKVIRTITNTLDQPIFILTNYRILKNFITNEKIDRHSISLEDISHIQLKGDKGNPPKYLIYLIIILAIATILFYGLNNLGLARILLALVVITIFIYYNSFSNDGIVVIHSSGSTDLKFKFNGKNSRDRAEELFMQIARAKQEKIIRMFALNNQSL